MTKLRLFGSPISSNCHKVQCFLEEINIPYELKLVDLMKAEQRKPDFLALNSLGAVPTIEVNGFHLAESNAILRYLAQKYEKYAYYPINLEDNARVNQMMDFLTLHVARWISTINWHRVMMPTMMGQKGNPATIQEAEQNLLLSLPRLERHLARTGTFICGPHPTIADIAFTPLADQSKDAQISLTDFPFTQKYINQLVNRPAWQKVAAELKRLNQRK